MKPVAAYTLARVGLFVLVWVPVLLISLIWLDWNSLTVLWTLLIAMVVSALVSFVALRGLRDQVARQAEHGVARTRKRFDQTRRKEDVD